MQIDKVFTDYVPELYLHSHNVSFLATLLGYHMGLPKKDIAFLRQAALFHDCGKLFVPSSLLLQPRKLTIKEFQVVRKHTLLGYQHLMCCGRPEEAVIALRHHERMDGTGYPDGLSGHDIPLAARIVAVADSLAAMLESRPYKIAHSLPGALKELAALQAKYDPAVLQALATVDTEEIRKGVLGQWETSAMEGGC